MMRILLTVFCLAATTALAQGQSGERGDRWQRVVLSRSRLAEYRADVNPGGKDFPRLGDRFEVVRPPSKMFNCIAWVVGRPDLWVNPFTSPRANPLDVMDDFFAKRGFRPMEKLDFRLDARLEKIVLYAKVENRRVGTVTHAARQARDGAWTSKLGANALIKHIHPDDLRGPLYGVPVSVYSRPWPR